jgi:hypothetical protein
MQVETSETWTRVLHSGIIVGTLPNIPDHSINPLVHHSHESGPFPLNVGWNG